MSKFERIKQKIRENKGKIILGCISVAGVIYVIVNQNGKIKMLSDENETLSNNVETLNNDVRVLKGVITENVLVFSMTLTPTPFLFLQTARALIIKYTRNYL